MDTNSPFSSCSTFHGIRRRRARRKGPVALSVLGTEPPIAAARRANRDAPGKQVVSSSRRGDRPSRDGGRQRELRAGRGAAGIAYPDRSRAHPPVAGGKETSDDRRARGNPSPGDELHRPRRRMILERNRAIGPERNSRGG
jgi:hypothetical protein